jgi:hypothetical protein
MRALHVSQIIEHKLKAGVRSQESGDRRKENSVTAVLRLDYSDF